MTLLGTSNRASFGEQRAPRQRENTRKRVTRRVELEMKVFTVHTQNVKYINMLSGNSTQQMEQRYGDFVVKLNPYRVNIVSMIA